MLRSISTLRCWSRAASGGRSAILGKGLFLLPVTRLSKSFSSTSPAHIQFIDMPPQVPGPTETVPDVESFLKKIGRNTLEYVEHFESWNKLMTITTEEMKEKGIETRQRRYILACREKFRRGEEPKEIKRGKKKWGGERRRKANRAAHFGRLRAELRAKEAK
jgi:hypothetical protein